MKIERLEQNQRMSKATIHNNTAYLCGQIAKDPSKDITEQTITTLEKVDEILAQLGSEKSKILSATIYIKDMSLFDEMNAIWDDWAPQGHAPARACVEARMAADNLLVEVSVIAAI
jgi:enamine deaminase RidA (YjgF/YER057c/UK114 family)